MNAPTAQRLLESMEEDDNQHLRLLPDRGTVMNHDNKEHKLCICTYKTDAYNRAGRMWKRPNIIQKIGIIKYKHMDVIHRCIAVAS